MTENDGIGPWLSDDFADIVEPVEITKPRQILEALHITHHPVILPGLAQRTSDGRDQFRAIADEIAQVLGTHSWRRKDHPNLVGNRITDFKTRRIDNMYRVEVTISDRFKVTIHEIPQVQDAVAALLFVPDKFLEAVAKDKEVEAGIFVYSFDTNVQNPGGIPSSSRVGVLSYARKPAFGLPELQMKYTPVDEAFAQNLDYLYVLRVPTM